MEQILINLIAGALGGLVQVNHRRLSILVWPGTLFSGLVGGGPIAALCCRRSTIGQSEHWRDRLTGYRRRCWWCHIHGDHWSDQEQGRRLNHCDAIGGSGRQTLTITDPTRSCQSQ